MARSPEVTVEEGHSRRLRLARLLMLLPCAISLTVLGFNLAGDALRDIFDPRLRGR